MKPRFLMCPPEHFGVHYTINPWMQDQIGKVNSSTATRQWTEYYDALSCHADIELIDPEPHMPDLVFTANAGLMIDGHFIASRFKHEERRREEPLFREWFETRATRFTPLPKNLFFEGAGDALLQPGGKRLWAGHGFRTDRETHPFLAENMEMDVISLRLTHPSFYHLDTCLCPLLDDHVMYYPAAFDEDSLKLIETQVPPDKRIIVTETDALRFACNAVLVERTLFLNDAGPELIQLLEHKGYTPTIQPVSEFLKAGGGNKCLTLTLF